MNPFSSRVACLLVLQVKCFYEAQAKQWRRRRRRRRADIKLTFARKWLEKVCSIRKYVPGFDLLQQHPPVMMRHTCNRYVYIYSPLRFHRAHKSKARTCWCAPLHFMELQLVRKKHCSVRSMLRRAAYKQRATRAVRSGTSSNGWRRW